MRSNERARVREDYPCFASSSVESCINAYDNGEITLRELREGKPCPLFDKDVELTETARKAYYAHKEAEG